jgi:hypothetical protein
MLIRILIESTQPLAGTAATEEAEPLHFDGWLELLRVVSELVAAAPSGGEDADAAEPMQRKPDGDGTRHPEPPAHEQPADDPAGRRFPGQLGGSPPAGARTPMEQQFTQFAHPENEGTAAESPGDSRPG